MTVTYDLYKVLELERSWDEKTIRSKLKERQKFWTSRQSSCNDKEQLLIIDELMNKIEDAYRFLIKPIKRKQYDEALDKAYKEGIIKDETEEKMKSLLEQAMAYYRKGNIKLAANCAQEAIDGNLNDPKAYDILARCHFDMQSYQKAIDTVDTGIKIYTDNLDLHWLGARIATVGTQNYDDAQIRVNKLIEIAPNNSIGHSEQIFLHLRKGDEDLALQEIDSYISANPSDSGFKRSVAYDLDTYSNSCYYYDAASNSSFIADKTSYEKCLRLRNKAVEIYSDEHTQKQLENAKYYGTREWDSWNIDSIKSLTIYGIILLFLFWPVGLALLIIDVALICFSFRPYWQINKTYVTGEMGTAEKLVSVLGDYAARFGGWFIRFIWKLVIWFIRFIFWLASGGPFR
ncbi:MAG: hypothetical protein Q4D26_07875 [Clostridia bacterium]|nr:hypothetical protein [Clostridia bacterium]